MQPCIHSPEVKNKKSRDIKINSEAHTRSSHRCNSSWRAHTARYSSIVHTPGSTIIRNLEARIMLLSRSTFSCFKPCLINIHKSRSTRQWKQLNMYYGGVSVSRTWHAWRESRLVRPRGHGARVVPKVNFVHFLRNSSWHGEKNLVPPKNGHLTQAEKSIYASKPFDLSEAVIRFLRQM